MGQPKGLAALKAAGAILGDEPRKVQVVWKNDDGVEHSFDIWVRPMAFGTALELRESGGSNKIAQALGSLVLLEGDDGALAPLGYDAAVGLHPGLGWELLKAVNGDGGKNSPPPTS